MSFWMGWRPEKSWKISGFTGGIGSLGQLPRDRRSALRSCIRRNPRSGTLPDRQDGLEESSNCSAERLPSCPTRLDFWMPLPTSQKRVWTLAWHARRIPIRRLWRARVLPEPQTTRKPLLLLWLSGLFLLRFAERQLIGLLFQEPPRSLACPSLLYLLAQARAINSCWRNCQVSPCSRWASQL
jgi:hypothetical protein